VDNDLAADMERGADMTCDVAIDVACGMVSDVASDISSTTHEWMGPVQRRPLNWV